MFTIVFVAISQKICRESIPAYSRFSIGDIIYSEQLFDSSYISKVR